MPMIANIQMNKNILSPKSPSAHVPLITKANFIKVMAANNVAETQKAGANGCMPKRNQREPVMAAAAIRKRNSFNCAFIILAGFCFDSLAFLRQEILAVLC